MYKIGELSKIVGMSIHGLRFYEKEGLISPERNGQNRIYSEEDRLWIEFLMHMKGTGMSLADMKLYTTLRKQQEPPLEDLMNILKSHRKKVEKEIALYEKNLRLLDSKIKIYEKQIENHNSDDLFDRFVKNYNHKM